MQVSVVLVILTVADDELRVLLIHRSGQPYLGWWALPGGFLHAGESLAEAAERKLGEETGVAEVYLEQLFTFDDLDGPSTLRPGSGEPGSGRATSTSSGKAEAGSVAVAYFALVDAKRVRLRDEPAWEPRWFPVADLPDLAFDNAKVVDYAITRLRNKLDYTNVAYSLLPASFTLSDLQAVYESIFGRSFDKRNFRRRMLSLGIIRPTGQTAVRGAHRPAELFEFTSRQPMLL